MLRRWSLVEYERLSCVVNTLLMLRPPRMERIYLVYLVCFVLAVFSPSYYTRGYFGISETILEEFTIFIFGLAGLLIFTTYEKYMEKREQEQVQVEDEYMRLKSELIESYAYIGSMNRKLELLKRVANETSVPLGTKRVARELFGALVAHAAAASDASAVLLRFVELSRLRTDHEFSHLQPGATPVGAANKDLKAVAEQGTGHAFIRSTDGREILVIPSDTVRDTRAFLLVSWKEGAMPELDTSLLKVFVNQAEALADRLFHIPLPEDAKLAAPPQTG